jgi:CP family cyanate transporter-like MFS transporter
LAVALTIPVVLPLAGGSWRMSFVLWGVPVIATAILVVLFAPRATAPVTSGPRRWWPDWRDKQLWRLALCLGCINTCYFGTNTFLPDYLHALGRDDLISVALTALNFCQLPASFLMLGLAPLLVRKHWAYASIGLLSLCSIVGMATSGGLWVVFWAGLLGFFVAAGLILILALPPLLSAPEDVHRMASAMFTISYPCAVLMSVVAGYAWDATLLPWIAFVPIGFCALMLALLSLRIEFREAPAARSLA